MIPSQIIEEIRNKADIVKVVSEYVQIKKRGKNYLGLCPFHAEKDPSFTVSPEKQLFHCFGCNQGGNIFAFIMKIENIGFAEAVEELGAKLGVSVPKSAASQQLLGSKSEKDQLYQLMLLASKFFQDSLNGKAGEDARAYLDKRKISSETRKLFSLGFAPPGWDNLFKHLVSRGVAPGLIEKSGLILPRDSQTGYYDRFRNRLIFPIIDYRSRVIAFGGRSLGSEEPKYLNSPDTAIYHKGETVFGLNLSKEQIKKSKIAVLVEGYFDLITPFQAGISNLVASLGTALTPLQAKLLARYSETVILAFDADAAGGEAAERSVEILRKQGLKVKVALLPASKDPDELIRNQGEKAFAECIASALPYLEFKIKRALGRHNLAEIESRSKALQEVSAFLAQEKDAFVQKEYAKLAAQLLSTDSDTVLAEIKRLSRYSSSSRDFSRRQTSKPPSKIIEAEKNLLALAAQSRQTISSLKEQIEIEDFTLPEAKAVAELMFSADFSKEENPSHFLLDNLPGEEARAFLSRILLSEHLSQQDKTEAILRDSIAVIKKERLKNKIEALKVELKEAEKSGKSERAAELLSLLKSEIS